MPYFLRHIVYVEGGEAHSTCRRGRGGGWWGDCTLVDMQACLNQDTHVHILEPHLQDYMQQLGLYIFPLQFMECLHCFSLHSGKTVFNVQCAYCLEAQVCYCALGSVHNPLKA